jgi:aryl-alcohol dehydrogenase-like predicted oxidoreductase
MGAPYVHRRVTPRIFPDAIKETAMTMNRYTLLGRSGLRVSPISLGTMTFGTEWGWGADEKAAQRLFDLYVDAGGNFIDSADLYTEGTSEKWVGKFAAARGLRDRLVIATKYSYNAESGNPNAVAITART